MVGLDKWEIKSAAVDVPEPHQAAGLTITYPPAGLAGQGLCIHSSARKPHEQALAAKHRGSWFWVNETDQRPKAVFRFLRT